MSLELVRTH